MEKKAFHKRAYHPGKAYFEGYYYKHQKGEHTLCFIPGRNRGQAFIQVIADGEVYHIPYIGENEFSSTGVRVDIDHPGCHLTGEIRYSGLTPLRSDIMGPFARLPMQCRHGVLSMRHRLAGGVQLNGRYLDFTDGVGYIEKDSGRSFPRKYLWVQCNDFPDDDAVMAAVADIPFLGGHFTGCVSAVWHAGREYRFATYRGVRIEEENARRLRLRQGKYRLIIDMCPSTGQELLAPQAGAMTRLIRESPCAPARFRLYDGETLLLDRESPRASMEYVE